MARKFRWKYPDLSVSKSFQMVQLLLPLLVIFTHFDDSGLGTVALSCFIFTFTAVKHLMLDDFVPKSKLLKIRSKLMA